MMNSVNESAPTKETDSIPYWRLTLRGCSQICFQSNEWTGLFFLAAVFVASPIAAAYLLAAAILAPAGRMLLGERGPVLETGLPGLNPCLIALALPAFFETGWTNVGMWCVLLICVAIAVVLVRICVAVLPFPTLAVPFLIEFWVLNDLAPQLDVLQPIALSVHPTAFHPITAVLSSLAAALFASGVWSGLLFIAGILVSDRRHCVVAIIGAVIGTTVSYYYHHDDPENVNLGIYGFNAVLTAVSVFELCGGKLRLSILAALLATILTPAVAVLGVQTLSAPFVLTTWLMLALGWVEEHWISSPASPDSSSAPALKPSTNSKPA